MTVPDEFTPYIVNLEELSANAWPSPVVQLVDGWRLRFGWGVTRRANSVLVTADGGRLPIAEKIQVAQDFYARRRRPARFALSDAPVCHEPDAALAERGFVLEAPTVVSIAQAAAVATSGDGSDEQPEEGSTTNPDRVEISFTELPDEEWVKLWWNLRSGGAADAEAELVGRVILESTGPRCAMATASVGGQPVGVGRVAVERGWSGISAMHVHPDCRGQGIGGSLLRALARWGLEAGGASCYLQVEEDNEGARRFYESHGFAPAYRTWYRVQG